jgi:predicted DNA-binding protein (MmcQ/YjbR family)
MDIEEIRIYALQKDFVTEGFPFGGDTLVFKVKEKMFLLASLDKDPISMNLKCDPDKALELREEYPDAILPGYHMNKRHWNTVIIGGLNNSLIKEMIDESYLLVIKK